jgi:hypothetical protein
MSDTARNALMQRFGNEGYHNAEQEEKVMK